MILIYIFRLKYFQFKFSDFLKEMENRKLNVNALAAKFQSKNEVYRFLTIEVDMHLPPQIE